MLRRYCCGLIIILFLSIPIVGQESIINRVELVGSLALVGSDYNIHTVDFETGETVQLTNDGASRARYEFPTWSRDGKLAYFCCSVRGSESPRLNVFVSENGSMSGDLFYNAEGERHVYAYWSPVTCSTEDCVDLAILIQNFSEPQLRVDLFNSASIANNERNLGVGTPFYFSWSPSGESMVMHRNNRLLQYYSVDTNEVVSAGIQSLGNFLSPGWSPKDNRIAFASTSEDSLSLLSIQEDNDVFNISAGIDGIISFSWSPNGQFIAYRYITRDIVSPVYIVNAINGELVAQSNVSGVFAFFWSPDSNKIAYITLSNPPGTFDIRNTGQIGRAYMMQSLEGLAWNVLNIADNTNTLMSSFVPTLEMQYLLTNFDQFAQSHSIWSPDSRYIVYGDIIDLDTASAVITVLDTDNSQLDTIAIQDGVFAVWSYE